MALRALQGPTGGGAPVGGGGTSSPSTIPRWTGPSTLGDSVITQNSTALVTAGSASATQTTFRVLTVGTANNAPASSWFRSGVAEFVQYISSAGALAFAANPAGFTDAQLDATAKVWITSSGNVGIGTASPLWKNHTVGAGLLLSGTAFNLAAVNQDQTTYRGVSLGYDTSGQIGVIASTGATSSLAFWTNNAGTWGERARIDSNGNLVVGLSASASTSTNRLQLANNSTAKQGIEFRPGVTIGGGTGNEIVNYDRNLGVYLGTEWSSSFFRLSLNGSYFEASTNGAGLKLNATPGNTDPNTLDAYRDGGTAGSGGVSFTATLKGLVSDPTTPVTATGKYILVGKLLVMTIVFSDVNTTGAAGAIYVQTNLAAALRPERNCVGAVTLDSIATITGVGTHVIANTGGDIYVAQNTSNAAVSFCTHNAGAARGLTITVSYMIP